MSLDAEFQSAIERVKTLEQLPNDVLLKLYALFKQASLGDVQGKKPGAFDLKAKAKYKAWSLLKGKSSDEAKQDYIRYVDKLLGSDSSEAV